MRYIGSERGYNPIARIFALFVEGSDLSVTSLEAVAIVVCDIYTLNLFGKPDENPTQFSIKLRTIYIIINCTGKKLVRIKGLRRYTIEV